MEPSILKVALNIKEQIMAKLIRQKDRKIALGRLNKLRQEEKKIISKDLLEVFEKSLQNYYREDIIQILFNLKFISIFFFLIILRNLINFFNF